MNCSSWHHLYVFPYLCFSKEKKSISHFGASSTGLSDSHWLPSGTCLWWGRNKNEEIRCRNHISISSEKKWLHSVICFFRILSNYSHLWNTPEIKKIQELNLHHTGLSLPPHLFINLITQQLWVEYQLCPRHWDHSSEQNRIPALTESLFQRLGCLLIKHLPEQPGSLDPNLSSAPNCLLNLGKSVGFLIY